MRFGGMRAAGDTRRPATTASASDYALLKRQIQKSSEITVCRLVDRSTVSPRERHKDHDTEVDCMSRRHRSAWRRRLPQGRTARIAVPLAIPVALAAIVGIIIAVSGGGISQVNQSALANCV